MLGFDIAHEISAERPPEMTSSAPTPEGGGVDVRPPGVRALVVGAFGVWLATRLAYALFTYFGVLFRANLPVASSPTGIGPHTLLAAWQRWDAMWYLGIAAHGYTSAQATAFFPLYPLLVKGVSLIVGPHWLLAGLGASSLASLAAFIGIALLAASELDGADAAWRTLRVTLAYPLAFFLTAPYSDSTFLACAAFALYAARRGSWRWAGACAALAGLARPTGVVLALPLLYEYSRQHDLWRRIGERRMSRAEVRSLGAALLVASSAVWGIALYSLYLWRRFGDPLLFAHAEHRFWRHATWNSSSVTAAVHQAHAAAFSPWTYEFARGLVDQAPVVLFLLLTLLALRRMPVAFTLYMVCVLTLAVASPRPGRIGLVVSAGRYLLASIPIFLLLAAWTKRHPWLDHLLMCGGFLLQAVFALYFLAGGWMV